jgi:hypothetical protein
MRPLRKALRILSKENKNPLYIKVKVLKYLWRENRKHLVKHFEEPVVRNEETAMQRKKGKSKATKKPDEVDKTLSCAGGRGV